MFALERGLEDSRFVMRRARLVYGRAAHVAWLQHTAATHGTVCARIGEALHQLLVLPRNLVLLLFPVDHNEGTMSVRTGAPVPALPEWPSNGDLCKHVH